MEKSPSLMEIATLKDLQRMAEQLDDMTFNHDRLMNRKEQRPVGRNHSFRNHQNYQTQLKNQTTFHGSNGTAPMQLDNIEQTPLTTAEKEIYRKNNWCTYCRLKSHTIDKCFKRQNQNNGKNNKINNISISTTTEEPITISSSSSTAKQ
jgi:hypothetical protein